ncbi:MAG: hypothetical protein P8L39_00030 [Halioglobus sp.]|nr:hypothetical protein [Halioglobus sp.]
MDSLPAKRGNVSGGARDGGANWGRAGASLTSREATEEERA